MKVFWLLNSSVDHVVKKGELAVEVKIRFRTISETTAHRKTSHYHCWTEKDLQEVLSHFAATPAQLWLSWKYLQKKTSASNFNIKSDAQGRRDSMKIQQILEASRLSDDGFYK